MDDPVATDVDVEFEAPTSEVLELNEEWIAYLEAQPVPDQFAGVNEEITYTADPSATGLA